MALAGDIIEVESDAEVNPRHEMVCLSVLTEEQKSCCISAGQIVVGRHPTCDIHLESQGVSHFHLRFTVAEGKVQVKLDRESSSKTYVNLGEKLEPGKTFNVCSGDIIWWITIDGNNGISGDIDRKPIVALTITVGADERKVDKLPHFHKLLKPDSGTSLAKDPQVVVNSSGRCKPASAAIVYADEHLSLSQVAGGSCTLHQISKEGCYVNELFVPCDARQELRDGDFISLCKIQQRFCPRHIFVFRDLGRANLIGRLRAVPTPKPPPEQSSSSLTQTVAETTRWSPDNAEDMPKHGSTSVSMVHDRMEQQGDAALDPSGPVATPTQPDPSHDSGGSVLQGFGKEPCHDTPRKKYVRAQTTLDMETLALQGQCQTMLDAPTLSIPKEFETMACRRLPNRNAASMEQHQIAKIVTPNSLAFSDAMPKGTCAATLYEASQEDIKVEAASHTSENGILQICPETQKKMKEEIGFKEESDDDDSPRRLRRRLSTFSNNFSFNRSDSDRSESLVMGSIQYE